MTYRIKDWKEFQHFKDRSPPWIKLYRKLLDDLEWHELSGDDAKALTMLWLLASETDGVLPDIKTISFRLRQPMGNIEPLLIRLNHWVESDDITMISSRYHDDDKAISLARSQETETETYREETETETETEEEIDAQARKLTKKDYGKVAEPAWLPVVEWLAYLEMRRKIKKFPTPHAIELAFKTLHELRQKGHDPAAVLNQSTMNNYTGLFELKENYHAKRNSSAPSNAGKTKTERLNDVLNRHLDEIDSRGGTATGADARPMLPSPEAVRAGTGASGRGDSDV